MANFAIFLFYANLKVEEKLEQLVYGFDSALVAIGGNMGLYLGFSCLSISFWIIDMMEQKFGRKG